MISDFLVLQTIIANEDATEEKELTEAAWEKWQVAYGIRRNKLFAPFLLPLKKRISTGRDVIVVSSAKDCYIELIHRYSDAGMWIVRRSKRLLWFRRQISSNWFNDEVQARGFADEMKRECDAAG